MGKRITRFAMKDVRCFKGEQSLNIRPITLLVGENSTGKSTVLGCYHALLYLFSQYTSNFNIPPFEMGSFADIVRKEKNANTEFMISIDEDFDSESDFDKKSINYQFTFGDYEGESVIRRVAITFSSGGSITLAYSANKGGGIIDLPVETTPNNFLIEYHDIESSTVIGYFLQEVMPTIQQLIENPNNNVLSLENFLKNKIETITGKQELQSLFDIGKRLIAPSENFVSISPVRSKPKRTYDPLTRQVSSEGDDMPLFIRKLMHTNKKAWEYLHQELVKFGVESEMFKDIRIRTFNDDVGDPFQIQVKHAEEYVNIMDVGYGVSQILPILVSMIIAKYNKDNKNSPAFKPSISNLSTRFLLQEPVMHLHPKAQAAFGSLLVRFAEDGKGHSFLIENHSDFIVDRICTEIRDGNISPENVSLVYHETKNGCVQLHNITLDKMGNLENVPDGYRDFFMHEMNKVLGL